MDSLWLSGASGAAEAARRPRRAKAALAVCWALVASSADAARQLGVATRHVEHSGGQAAGWTSLDSCPIFVQTLYPEPPNAQQMVKQWDVRKQNVDEMIKAHPEIRRFNVLYYKRDWKTVTDLFTALNFETTGQKSKGAWCRWATMIMTFAWQSRFGKECMVTLEDDIQIPWNFSTRLSKVQLSLQEPEIIKFDNWGEGYVSNLPIISRVVDVLLQNGVGYHDAAADTFINSGVAGRVRQVNVGIKKLVATNAGNIYEVEPPSAGDFSSEGIHKGDKSVWELLAAVTGGGAGGFRPEDTSSGAVDLAGAAKSFEAGRHRAAAGAAGGGAHSSAPLRLLAQRGGHDIVKHLAALAFEADDFAGAGEGVVDLAGAAARFVARRKVAAAVAVGSPEQAGSSLRATATSTSGF